MPAARPALPSLTAWRGVAALLVLYAHSIGAFVQPAMRKAEATSGPLYTLGNSWPLGEVGMTLFFVLSGFVIHYNYGTALRGFAAKAIHQFSVARIARLVPLYALAVLLSMILPPEPTKYLWPALPYYLTLTQGWFPISIDNVPLGDMLAPGSWSISVEVGLYFAYVLFMVPSLRLLERNALLWTAMTLFVGVMTAFHFGRAWHLWMSDDYWLYYRSPLARGPEFILGALTAEVFIRRAPKGLQLAELRTAAGAAGAGIASIVALVLTATAKNGPALVLIQSWTVAPAVAAILYFTARASSPFSRAVENPALVQLGETSYSLYLLHFIVLFVFMAQGDATAPWIIASKFAAAWILVVLLAKGSFDLLEAPARFFIRRALGTNPRPAGVTKPSAAKPAPSSRGPELDRAAASRRSSRS